MTRQKGIALLSMMLVVVIVTAVTSKMLYNNQLEIKRGQTQMLKAQANEYAFSGIAWTRAHLQDKLNTSGKPPQLFQPPEGTLETRISDEMGKFNLNNLRDASGKIDITQLHIFERLLQLLHLDKKLALNLGDWLDSDISSAGYSTEDLGYQNREAFYATGYRTANRPMADASELLMVKGVTRENYAMLRPYITALPVKTGVNVNTASAVVLEALIPGIDGRAVVEGREQSNSHQQLNTKTFNDIDSFATDNVTAGLEIPADQLTTTSYYYLVTVSATYHQQPSNWQALLHITKTTDSHNKTYRVVTEIWRQQLPFWQSAVNVDSELSEH